MLPRLQYNLPHRRTLLRWIFVDRCGSAFGIVAILPPLEMASPLELLRNRVVCGAVLRCCVAAVELIPTVDIRGPISEVDFRCRPRWCWDDVGARRVFELPSVDQH